MWHSADSSDSVGVGFLQDSDNQKACDRLCEAYKTWAEKEFGEPQDRCPVPGDRRPVKLMKVRSAKQDEADTTLMAESQKDDYVLQYDQETGYPLVPEIKWEETPRKYAEESLRLFLKDHYRKLLASLCQSI